MTDLTCARHPVAKAVASCTRCGDMVCPDCRRREPEGLVLCPGCADPALSLDKPAAGPTPLPRPAGPLGPSPLLAGPALDTVPVGMAPDAPDDPIAWECGRDFGTLAALVATFKTAIGSPIGFMQRIPFVRGDLRTPLMLCLLAGILGQVAEVLWTLFLPVRMGPPHPFFASLGIDPVVGSLVALPGVPLWLTLKVFAQAALTHALLRMLGAAKRPFEATFRVYAYAGVAALLLLVPLLGVMLFAFFGVLFVLGGLRAAHGVTLGQALIGLLPMLVELFGLLRGVMGYG